MYRIATGADVDYVVERMRPEDAKEIELATGKPVAEAVAALGDKPYVAIVMYLDEPIAIFGATLEDDVATMFRFATPRWPEVVREAIRVGRRQMLPRFRKAGVRRVQAMTLIDSDTNWLKLFGGKETGGFWTKNGKFKTTTVDLAH